MDATTFVNEDVFTLINKHIDWIAVALVLLGGLFAKKYLWQVNFPVALKTLVVGSLFITVYICLMAASGQLYKADYTKYFFSYCFATTLYEVLLKRIPFLNKEEKEKP